MPNQTCEAYVSLSYNIVSTVGGAYDYEEYILRFHADILATVDIEGLEPNQLVKLGTFEFYIIHVGNAMNDNACLHSIFDTEQHLLDIGNVIYDPSYSDFSPVVEKLVDSERFSNEDILILHLLQIEPFARGHRLGLAAIDRVIRSEGEMTSDLTKRLIGITHTLVMKNAAWLMLWFVLWCNLCLLAGVIFTGSYPGEVSARIQIGHWFLTSSSASGAFWITVISLATSSLAIFGLARLAGTRPACNR